MPANQTKGVFGLKTGPVAETGCKAEPPVVLCRRVMGQRSSDLPVLPPGEAPLPHHKLQETATTRAPKKKKQETDVFFFYFLSLHFRCFIFSISSFLRTCNGRASQLQHKLRQQIALIVHHSTSSSSSKFLIFTFTPHIFGHASKTQFTAYNHSVYIKATKLLIEKKICWKHQMTKTT